MEEILSNQFWGIVTYEKVDDCLTGYWSNSDPEKSGFIMNEIARKQNSNMDCDFVGNYVVSWIEPMEEPTTGTLKITSDQNIFTLEWATNNNIIFRGRGLRLGVSRLVAIYWKFQTK